MSDNRSSSGNISGFIRARERTHRHHNVQRSNLQPSTFQRSSLYLVSSAHEREHTVITTFNVPTFNVQRSNVHLYLVSSAHEREHTVIKMPHAQPSTFQRSTFNLHHYNRFHTRSYWQYYTSGVTNYVLAPTSFTAAQWYSLVHHPTYQEQ